MVRLTDHPDMTIDVTVDIKQQHNNNTILEKQKEINITWMSSV